MDPDPSLLAGIGFCLLILALASAVDAAFTAVSWRRLSTLLADQAAHSRALAHLTNDPYRFKATIILLNTSAIIAASALTLELSHALSIWAQAGYLLLLLLAILVVSASLPKAVALRNPEATVRLFARPISHIAWLLGPLVSLIHILSRVLAKLTGNSAMSRAPLVLEEELRLLVDAGEQQGLLEHDEREMIEGVFSFGDTLVREVMVPRGYIVALEVDTPLSEALDTVINQGHSRIPVYDDTIDNIVGILYAKDLLPALRSHQPDDTVAHLLRPAHFVPESIKVDALLKELQHSRIHLAIVVDEYGGTAGLATIEDLIEEIVGEIQDEYDVEEPFIQVLSDTELVVDARATIEELAEHIDLPQESIEADRIGGLVFEQLGRVPRIGDEVRLDSMVVTVLSMKGVRPQKLRIVRQQPPAEEPAAALVPDELPDPLPLVRSNGRSNEWLQPFAMQEPHESTRNIYADTRLHRPYFGSHDGP